MIPGFHIFSRGKEQEIYMNFYMQIQKKAKTRGFHLQVNHRGPIFEKGFKKTRPCCEHSLKFTASTRKKKLQHLVC